MTDSSEINSDNILDSTASKEQGALPSLSLQGARLTDAVGQGVGGGYKPLGKGVRTLITFFNYCLQNHLPLAFYRLPIRQAGLSGTAPIKIIAQKTPALKKIPAGTAHTDIRGFLFAPFHEDKNVNRIIIQPDIYADSEHLPSLDFAKPLKGPFHSGEIKTRLKEAEKREYKELVLRIKGEISRGNFKKIVAARVVKKKKPGDFNPVSFFEKLCQSYPDAFVSLVYTPEYGLWLGASPEILLNVDAEGFKTYSLAGTKTNANGTSEKGWDEKEKEEQRLVSNYITQVIGEVAEKQPIVTGPETMKAGNVLHLRTTFVYPGIAHEHWLEITERLHPTPAVAGEPKQAAIDFILKNEKAPRGFYAGYLGPVNMDGEIHLFVNLRCMQVLKKKLALHVGGGITQHSKPSDEWKETKLKAKTLLTILNERRPAMQVTKNLSSLPRNEYNQKRSTGIGRSLSR